MSARTKVNRNADPSAGNNDAQDTEPTVDAADADRKPDTEPKGADAKERKDNLDKINDLRDTITKNREKELADLDAIAAGEIGVEGTVKTTPEEKFNVVALKKELLTADEKTRVHRLTGDILDQIDDLDSLWGTLQTYDKKSTTAADMALYKSLAERGALQDKDSGDYSKVNAAEQARLREMEGPHITNEILAKMCDGEIPWTTNGAFLALGRLREGRDPKTGKRFKAAAARPDADVIDIKTGKKISGSGAATGLAVGAAALAGAAAVAALGEWKPDKEPPINDTEPATVEKNEAENLDAILAAEYKTRLDEANEEQNKSTEALADLENDLKILDKEIKSGMPPAKRADAIKKNNALVGEYAKRYALLKAIDADTGNKIKAKSDELFFTNLLSSDGIVDGSAEYLEKIELLLEMAKKQIEDEMLDLKKRLNESAQRIASAKEKIAFYGSGGLAKKPIKAGEAPEFDKVSDETLARAAERAQKPVSELSAYEILHERKIECAATLKGMIKRIIICRQQIIDLKGEPALADRDARIAALREQIDGLEKKSEAMEKKLNYLAAQINEIDDVEYSLADTGSGATHDASPTVEDDEDGIVYSPADIGSGATGQYEPQYTHSGVPTTADLEARVEEHKRRVQLEDAKAAFEKPAKKSELKQAKAFFDKTAEKAKAAEAKERAEALAFMRNLRDENAPPAPSDVDMGDGDAETEDHIEAPEPIVAEGSPEMKQAQAAVLSAVEAITDPTVIEAKHAESKDIVDVAPMRTQLEGYGIAADGLEKMANKDIVALHDAVNDALVARLEKLRPAKGEALDTAAIFSKGEKVLSEIASLNTERISKMDIPSLVRELDILSVKIQAIENAKTPEAQRDGLDSLRILTRKELNALGDDELKTLAEKRLAHLKAAKEAVTAKLPKVAKSEPVPAATAKAESERTPAEIYATFEAGLNGLLQAAEQDIEKADPKGLESIISDAKDRIRNIDNSSRTNIELLIGLDSLKILEPIELQRMSDRQLSQLVNRRVFDLQRIRDKAQKKLDGATAARGPERPKGAAETRQEKEKALAAIRRSLQDAMKAKMTTDERGFDADLESLESKETADDFLAELANLKYLTTEQAVIVGKKENMDDFLSIRNEFVQAKNRRPKKHRASAPPTSHPNVGARQTVAAAAPDHDLPNAPALKVEDLSSIDELSDETIETEIRKNLETAKKALEDWYLKKEKHPDASSMESISESIKLLEMLSDAEYVDHLALKGIDTADGPFSAFEEGEFVELKNKELELLNEDYLKSKKMRGKELTSVNREMNRKGLKVKQISDPEKMPYDKLQEIKDLVSATKKGDKKTSTKIQGILDGLSDAGTSDSTEDAPEAKQSSDHPTADQTTGS